MQPAEDSQAEIDRGPENKKRSQRHVQKVIARVVSKMHSAPREQRFASLEGNQNSSDEKG